jgi:hypothetical protein
LISPCARRVITVFADEMLSFLYFHPVFATCGLHHVGTRPWRLRLSLRSKLKHAYSHGARRLLESALPALQHVAYSDWQGLAIRDAEALWHATNPVRGFSWGG